MNSKPAVINTKNSRNKILTIKRQIQTREMISSYMTKKKAVCKQNTNIPMEKWIKNMVDKLQKNYK